MAQAQPERAIVFCVGAVQFVNILDFMIVMPLGPDFAAALGIPLAKLGFVGGSYTAAASVSGLLGALVLDRFDRKRALGVCLVGLVLGTLGGAFATGLGTLLLARIVAGAFGGPATSLSLSIIADVIPPARRGRAMGAVMGAFSIASILGVPAGLELARRGGWRLPFVAVAVLGALVAVFTQRVLPPMSGHLAAARGRPFGRDLLGLLRRDVALAMVMTAFVMASSFILIPNLAPYLVLNLGYPRAQLGLLYMVGGVASLGTMRLAGALVDRHGSARVATFGTLFVVGVVYAGFVSAPPLVPVMAIFVAYMVGMGFRNVACNTLMSKVPGPDERARFASVQSAIQHLASALGAFASTQLLRELPSHRLAGMQDTAVVSIALACCLVPFLWAVERNVAARG
jgi:predicted MFS family arabinose efflux permease